MTGRPAWLRTLLLILLVFVSSRMLLRSLPGDPLETLIAETGTSLPREVLRHELGLDLPFWPSLAHDLKNGLGKSITTGDPVLPTLLSRLINTILLSSSAMLAALAVALPVALLGAGQRAARIAVILPTTWTGPLLLYLFGVLIPWVEVQGSSVLACLTLAIPLTGGWVRLIGMRVREETREPHFRTALGKGLSRPRALLKHALAPAAGALLAVLGTQWGALLGGTFIVETIFDLEGLGTTWIRAVLQRDYPMVEGATFIGASTCLLGVAMGDWLQSWWDPR